MVYFNRYGAVVAGVAVLVVRGAVAQSYPVNLNTPTIDRWNYPFDNNNGFSEAAAVFSAYGQELAFAPLYTFDTRDSQMILGWDTNQLVPTGLGACRYRVTGATVRIALIGDPTFEYDATYDTRATYLTGGVDPDPGRPVEVYGIAFRSGWTPGAPTQTNCPGGGFPGFPCYYEGTIEQPGPPFGPSIHRDVRYAFATDFIGGNERDISNNIRDGFDPKPFCVGQIPGLTPGAFVQPNTDMVFELNVNDADVQAYLRRGFDTGRLLLGLSSMQPASSVGGPGSGQYAKFYCKENPFGYDSGTNTIRWARLSMTVDVINLVGDITGDGAVNTSDLVLLLGSFGQNTGGPADLNCDGVVNTNDLIMLLANFGQ